MRSSPDSAGTPRGRLPLLVHEPTKVLGGDGEQLRNLHLFEYGQRIDGPSRRMLGYTLQHEVIETIFRAVRHHLYLETSLCGDLEAESGEKVIHHVMTFP